MTAAAKKWCALAAAILIVLVAYTAAGPYLAIRGIHHSLQTRDVSRLQRYVDFAAVRGNLRAQLQDQIARATDGFGDGWLAGLARGVASELGGPAVDALASPRGIAALLEGRAIARRVTAQPAPVQDDDGAAHYQPLADARTRYESLSRFVATTTDGQCNQTVFVFERRGLRWRLTDIRLPASINPSE